MGNPRCNIVLLLLHLWNLMSVKGQEQDVPTLLAGPSSVNASVNSNVTFSCTISTADLVLWFVNGSSIDTVPNLVDKNTRVCVDDCTNDTYVNYVTFTIEKNIDVNQLNNSGISCVGAQDSVLQFSSPSLPALLLIQGVLSSPIVYEHEVANGSVWLGWIAPYTMTGVQIDWYYVNVTISTLNATSNQLTFKAYGDECSFEAVDNSSCTVYNVGIQAVTLAGLGQQASINISRLEAPESLSPDQVKVDVSFENESVLVTFRINQPDCPGRYATSATINIYLQNEVLHSEDSDIDDYNRTIVHTVEVPITNEGDVVTSDITLSNSAGSTPSESIKIDLSCLKNVSVNLKDSNTMIACEFHSNCDPKECTVVLQHDRRPKISSGHYFILESQENSTISQVLRLDCGTNYYSAWANTTLMVFAGSCVHENNDTDPFVSTSWCIAPSNKEQTLTTTSTGKPQDYTEGIYFGTISVASFIAGLTTGIFLLLYCQYRKKKRDKLNRKRTSPVRYSIMEEQEGEYDSKHTEYLISKE